MFVSSRPALVNFLKKAWPATVLLLAAVALSACAPVVKAGQDGPKVGAPAAPRESGRAYTVRGRSYQLLASSDGFREEGLAAFYGKRFNGRKTASGERFSNNAMTAAHKTLPFNTMVEVKNVKNGKSVVVRINDRGPFSHKFIIDLSQGAARAIGLSSSGRVSIRALGAEEF